ncbi:protein FAM81A-like, partial [Megalops cyprinoides]|uniref:protein FAM81A-like n=1 Tax=Megalops cyprinoides TaxID=118141 RepID=UPI001863C2C1
SGAALVDTEHGGREIVSSVRGLQGRGVGDVQVVRLMLEEHIHAVTILVQRLNRDIEVLQEQLRARDEVTYRTHTAMQRMELQQLSVLGDLRGRVARCDANIAGLSADLRSTNEDVQNLSREQQTCKAVLEARLRKVESQLSLMCSKIDQSASLQETKKKTPEGHSSQLDSKLKGVADDLKAHIFSVQSWMEKEQENTVKEVINKIEQLSQLIKNKSSSSDRAIQEKYSQLSGKPEETQRRKAELKRERGSEQMLNARISRIEKRLWDEVQNMRAETNTGFAVIHESLGALRKVLEAKMRLEREQLERQIRQAQRRGGRPEQRETMG